MRRILATVLAIPAWTAAAHAGCDSGSVVGYTPVFTGNTGVRCKETDVPQVSLPQAR